MSVSPAPPQPDGSSLPAIDHAGGIARLMGDGALFARVLGRFRKDYRQAAAGIGAALDAGDIQLALRLAHTLKGAAGMIEAVPLRREAQALEQALRAGGASGPGLEKLERELGRVLAELDALPLAPPAPPAATARDGVLERLLALLDEGNGDAVDLVRDGGAALAARLGEERYLALAAAVEAFDFDGALTLLGKTERAG